MAVSKQRASFMWLLAAGFFFAEYFARVAPSVMATPLMATFRVHAFALGSLSAFFYYAYLIMQIPAGAMIDVISTKKLLSLMAILCGISSYLFSLSNTLYAAEINRVVMGFSAAFAFVGALKIARQWFPSYRFGLLAGATQALGMLGAAVGEGPVALLVTHYGWQQTMQWISYVLLFIGIGLFIIIKDKPQPSSQNTAWRTTFQAVIMIKDVLSHGPTWINGIFAGLLYAPTAAFAELWGPSYLHTVYHIPLTVAADAVSLIFIGWAIGGPIAGWISDRIQRRKPIMWVSSVLSLLLMAIILYLPNLSEIALFVLLFLYGIANVAVAITYVVAAEINPKAVAGTAMGFTNMASVIIGASFQPVIGKLLDLQWNGITHLGAPVYTAVNYKTAMMCLPICTFLAIIMCAFIKESFEKSST